MTTQLTVIQDRFRPFHCGTQHADWESCNCDRCTKNTPAGEGLPTCEIQQAIFEAFCGDGTVTSDVARRMGYADHRTAFLWQCGEVEWTEEWKAEHRRRQTWRYRIAAGWHHLRRRARKWIGERRDKLLTRWRMPIAVRHAGEGTNGCWADWCSWALGYGDKPDADGTARSCREEAERLGSCWCGKFRDTDKA